LLTRDSIVGTPAAAAAERLFIEHTAALRDVTVAA
jgi:hypothetical protein